MKFATATSPAALNGFTPKVTVPKDHLDRLEAGTQACMIISEGMTRVQALALQVAKGEVPPEVARSIIPMIGSDMDMHPVTSSMITAIGYDPEKQHLLVEFTSGKSYTYAGVSKDDFEAFKNAESIGKHFGANIRNQFKAP